MSPPPWLVMAAIKDVVTLLDRFRRSAAGPIFFRMSLSMVTVVPVERGVQILFGVYSSSVERRGGGGKLLISFLPGELLLHLQLCSLVLRRRDCLVPVVKKEVSILLSY